MYHVACLLQVFILDALVNYQVQDSKDAEKIVERVLPRLQHVNSAVVLSAAKVSWGMPEPLAACSSAALRPARHSLLSSLQLTLYTKAAVE
jgi:vesicle coat complex subunit